MTPEKETLSDKINSSIEDCECDDYIEGCASCMKMNVKHAIQEFLKEVKKEMYNKFNDEPFDFPMDDYTDLIDKLALEKFGEEILE